MTTPTTTTNAPSDWHPVHTPTPVAEPPSSAPPVAPPPPRRRGPGAAILAALLGVALLGGIVGSAADRWLAGQAPGTPPVAAPTSVPQPQTSTAPAPGSGSTSTSTQPNAADPTQLAIQQVIQRGDEEQAQALASKDPSVMQDTSTPAFYQEQVRTNQDLLANGVTAIKLVGIDWGAISVNGNGNGNGNNKSATATATAWETWSTTYSDGTTDQSRDRNVYTLVQDNGAWKVQSDEHPDAAGASGPGNPSPGLGNPGAPGTANPGPGSATTNPGTGNSGTGTPGRRAPGTGSGNPSGANPGTGGAGNPGTGPANPGTGGANPGTGNPAPGQRTPPGSTGASAQGVSANWAGYAASGGQFTSVTGTWTVPQFTPDSSAGADATWVGIGGLTSRDLIQAGTQQTVSGSGQTEYESWVETLPQVSHPLPVAVHPGDSVSVTISQQPPASDQWLVTFSNNTTGQSTQVTETYTSSLSSAEWIEEAPSGVRGGEAPLDNFGSVAFTQASTVKDGQTVSISQAGAHAITMAVRGQTLAQPSGLSADGSGFSVSRAAGSATATADGQPGLGLGRTPRSRVGPGLGSGSGAGSTTPSITSGRSS